MEPELATPGPGHQPEPHSGPARVRRLPVPSSRRRPGRIVTAALAAALVAGAAQGASDRTVRPDDLEPEILRAIMAIRRGFMTGSPDPILPLVHEASKVFISTPAIASETGFYSRDQLGALLRRCFTSSQTVSFTVKLDRIHGGQEGSEMVLLPAMWTFDRQATRSKVNLRFILSRRMATWTLKEIRESL